MKIDKYFVKAQQDTPEINFNPETGILLLAGRSFAEDVIEFYTPMIKWLESFFNAKPGGTIFIDFKMTYFSTATSKLFLDLLIKFEMYRKNGIDIKVRWFYDLQDEDILESGEEYAEMVQLPFDFKIYNPRKEIPKTFENQKRSA